MADMCKQCSIETWNEDGEDFRATTAVDDKRVVLCEGCGLTVVNVLGECISERCTKQHGVKS